MKLSPESIARASSRHSWRVIITWVLALVIAGVLSANLLAGALTTDFDFTDNPESRQALKLLEERRGESLWSEFVVVSSTSATIVDPEFAAYIEDLKSAVVALGSDVVVPQMVVSYGEVPYLASRDGTKAVVSVTLADPDPDALNDTAELLGQTVAGVVEPAGFETLMYGSGTLNNDYQELAEETLRRGETLGISIALVVLVAVIGALVAAILPIILAVAAIAVAMGVAALVGQIFELTFFVTNMITMIGLAVGIDYALFIVARYREERVRGYDKLEAIGRAGATANRAVFFSGMTVVLALLGMLFVPNTIFRSLGIGAIIVVVLAVAASMTLLPAVISLLGDRVNKGRIRRQASLENVDKIGGMWDKITRAVMGRAVLWLVGASALMIVLAIGYFSLETGFAGTDTLPEELESRQAFEILENDLGLGGAAGPLEVVIAGDVTPEVEAAMESFAAALFADGSFGPPTVDTALGLVSAPLVGDIQSPESVAAVERVRDDLVPAAFGSTGAEVLVGGWTAFTLDFYDDVDLFTPIVLAFVLGLSFLLLTVVFRSIVLPIKAIILNLLSVGAAWGMVVIFFQKGAGPEFVKDISNALDFIQVDEIEAWLPLFLFSVLFGLSMDYHVFLLTRIREHFDKTGDNSAAVAHGLRTTGAIITGAALIMVAVFGGFASGNLVMLQQMGFGLAVAVFLDATIVRSILVPSAMRLMGDWNWYLPNWLQWLPELHIEGHEAAEVAHAREEASVGG
jgi:RND superfamily putative drug exporter